MEELQEQSVVVAVAEVVLQTVVHLQQLSLVVVVVVALQVQISTFVVVVVVFPFFVAITWITSPSAVQGAVAQYQINYLHQAEREHTAAN